MWVAYGCQNWFRARDTDPNMFSSYVDHMFNSSLFHRKKKQELLSIQVYFFPHSWNENQAAELLFKFNRSFPEALSLVSWVLLILSFRLGTLLLCGTLCLDWRWPFIHKFSEIPLEKREEILKRWSREKRWIPLRLVFVLTKLVCFYNLFSRVM